MKTQSYELEGLAQSNVALAIYNSEVMEKLAHITVTMNVIQAQLKTLLLTIKNSTITKRKLYCWRYRRKFTHGSKTCYAKRTGHKEGAYYNKKLWGIEKG